MLSSPVLLVLVLIALPLVHSAVRSTSCDPRCNHGTAKDGNACCVAKGFERGWCGDDHETGRGVFALGKAYCYGGPAYARIFGCDRSDPEWAKEFENIYKLVKCDEKKD